MSLRGKSISLSKVLEITKDLSWEIPHLASVRRDTQLDKLVLEYFKFFLVFEAIFEVQSHGNGTVVVLKKKKDFSEAKAILSAYGGIHAANMVDDGQVTAQPVTSVPTNNTKSELWKSLFLTKLQRFSKLNNFDITLDRKFVQNYEDNNFKFDISLDREVTEVLRTRATTQEEFHSRFIEILKENFGPNADEVKQAKVNAKDNIVEEFLARQTAQKKAKNKATLAAQKALDKEMTAATCRGNVSDYVSLKGSVSETTCIQGSVSEPISFRGSVLQPICSPNCISFQGSVSDEGSVSDPICSQQCVSEYMRSFQGSISGQGESSPRNLTPMVHKASISVYSNVENIIYGEYCKHRFDIDVEGNNNKDGADKNKAVRIEIRMIAIFINFQIIS